MPPIPNGHNALTIAYSGNASRKKIYITSPSLDFLKPLKEPSYKITKAGDIDTVLPRICSKRHDLHVFNAAMHSQAVFPHKSIKKHPTAHSRCLQSRASAPETLIIKFGEHFDSRDARNATHDIFTIALTLVVFCCAQKRLPLIDQRQPLRLQ